MNSEDHTVLIVDDDCRVREGLSELLSAVGFHSTAFASIAEYVQFPRPDVPSCLILDVKLPDMDGLEFQARNAGMSQPPIVFITGFGDIRMSVSALKGGAVDFLTKPLRTAELIAAIRTAIVRDRHERQARAERASLERRLAQLTPRERDVMPLIVQGMLNKQVAAALGISEVTLQIHRRRVMQKMRASSLADLVRMSVTLGL